MLNVFIEWASSVAASQSGDTIEAHVTISRESDNPSARLDFDTPTAVARITFWESGRYDAEIIDIDSEQQMYASSGVLHTQEALPQLFSTFFDVLGTGTK